MTDVDRTAASLHASGAERPAGDARAPAEPAASQTFVRFDITDFTRLSAIDALLLEEKAVDAQHLLGNFLDQLQARWDDAELRQAPEALVDHLGSLGEEILAELRHLRAQRGGESRSSVQIEQGAKEVRITVKRYADSPFEEIGDDAIAEFGRLYRAIEQEQRDGWAQTLEQARARDGA